MKIIIGVDGSPSSARAVEWCAAHAAALEAEVVAVHSIEMPLYAGYPFGYVSLPAPSGPDRDELHDGIQREWCAPLSKANVRFRVVLSDGTPAPALIAIAKEEAADLVVTGRRGRGGFAELLLGSTSHALSHHLEHPLLIIP
jgi:nucleotide-binding universal stress UspA family protein